MAGIYSLFNLTYSIAYSVAKHAHTISVHIGIFHEPVIVKHIIISCIASKVSYFVDTQQ